MRPLGGVFRLLALDGGVRDLFVLRQLVSHLVSELLVLLGDLREVLARFVELVVEYSADFQRLRVDLLLRPRDGAPGLDVLLSEVVVQLARPLGVPLADLDLLELVVLLLARLYDQQVRVVRGLRVGVVVVLGLLDILVNANSGRLLELVFDILPDLALDQSVLLGHALCQNEVLRRNLTGVALRRVGTLLLLGGQGRRLWHWNG